MKKLYWYLAGLLTTIAIGTASAMYVGGELESALLEKLSSDPAGNEAQIYYNTTSKKAKLYNGSAWVGLGSGGAGEINYNDDADGTQNWTELGDGITVAGTTTEAEIPRWPIKTQAVKLTNDTSGTSGWSVCVEVGEADRNKKLKIEWAQIISTSPAYSSGEFTYQLFSETNDTCTGTETGVTLHSVGATTAVPIPAQNGVVYDEFDADDSQYYELKFVRASGASASFIGINDLVIGPGKLHSGAVVTAWEAFTPTGAWASNVTYAGIKRRVGDNLEMQLQLITSSGFNSTGNFYFNIPDSLTVDTSKINSTFRMVGYGNLYDNNVAANRQSAWVNVSSNTLRVFADGAAQVSETSPYTFAVSDRISVWVSVPILEWQGSGVLNVLTQDNINEWTLYPSTVTFTGYTLGNGTEEVWYRRVGSDLEIRYKTILGSTSVVSPGSITMKLPTDLGLTVDTNRFSNYYNVGFSTYLDSGTAANAVKGSVMQFSNGCLLYSDKNLNFVDNAIPFTWATSDQILFECRLPILEWAGSQSSLVGFSAATETQSGLVSTSDQNWQGMKNFSLGTFSGSDNSIIQFDRGTDAVQGAIGYDADVTDLYIGTITNHAFQLRQNNTIRMDVDANNFQFYHPISIRSSEAIFTDNSASAHFNAAIWQTDAVNTESCSTACAADEATPGLDTSSGTCLAGWSRSSGASIGCAATTGTKTCLCAGVNG